MPIRSAGAPATGRVGDHLEPTLDPVLGDKILAPLGANRDAEPGEVGIPVGDGSSGWRRPLLAKDVRLCSETLARFAAVG
jgi:hypothetical protein